MLDPRALLLVLILAVAVYVRIHAAADHIIRHPDQTTRLLGDEPGYQYLAERWAAGESLDWPARMPLYPIFLGTGYALFGVDLDLALYLHVLLGVATVAVLYVVVRRYHGESVALLAAALLSVHPGVILAGTKLHSENLYILLLILVAVGIFELRKRPCVKSSLLFAFSAAVSAYCRPTSALLFVLVPFALVGTPLPMRRRLELTAVAGAAVLVALVPWAVHNWRTYDVVHPLTPTIAVLWQGSPEYYELWRGGRSYLDIWSVELNATLNGGHEPTSWEGDRYFTRRALASIRAEPLTYAWYSMQKVIYYWAGHPSADWGGVPHMRAGERIAYIVTYLWAPLCFFAALTLRFWRRLEEFLPYLLLPVYFTAVHVTLWAELRLSLPLQPLLTVFLAVALVERVGVPLAARLTPNRHSSV